MARGIIIIIIFLLYLHVWMALEKWCNLLSNHNVHEKHDFEESVDYPKFVDQNSLCINTDEVTYIHIRQ